MESDCSLKVSKRILEAVSFATQDSITNVGYKVEVYTGVNPAKGPESGTLQSAATTSGKITLGGTYTITLNAPVELKGGEYFAVAVILDNGASVAIEADFNYSNWPGITSKVSAQKGQSFCKSGSTWTDLAEDEGANAVIHALTSNGSVSGNDTARSGNDPDEDAGVKAIGDEILRTDNAIDGEFREVEDAEEK